MARKRYKLQQEASAGIVPVYLDVFDSDEDIVVGDVLVITRTGKTYAVTGRVLVDGDSVDIVLVREFVGG